MTSINEIKNLISILPDKDQKLSYDFLDNRKFEELKEIVHSDVVKTEKKIKQLDVASEEYVIVDSNLNALLQLEECIDEYREQLSLGYNEVDDPTIYDDEQDDDEFLDHLYYMYCSHSTLIC